MYKMFGGGGGGHIVEDVMIWHVFALTAVIETP